MLGKSYHACYPPVADSGGKFTGCQHSKFGIMVMDSFLRVSRNHGYVMISANHPHRSQVFITSSNFMSLDFVYSDNVGWFGSGF